MKKPGEDGASKRSLPWQVSSLEGAQKDLKRIALEREDQLGLDELAKKWHLISRLNRRLYSMTEVFPAEGALENRGIVAMLEEQRRAGGNERYFHFLPGIRARYRDTNILVIRQPTYTKSQDQWRRDIDYFRALLAQEQPFNDVLVIDQRDNPGGSAEYVSEFYQLFSTPGEDFRHIVYQPNSDKGWIFNLRNEIDQYRQDLVKGPNYLASQRINKLQKQLKDLKEAYHHKRAAKFFPWLGLVRNPREMRSFVWTKPIVVLVDHLCVSGGDMFPLLMQGNQRGKFLVPELLVLVATSWKLVVL